MTQQRGSKWSQRTFRLVFGSFSLFGDQYIKFQITTRKKVTALPGYFICFLHTSAMTSGSIYLVRLVSAFEFLYCTCFHNGITTFHIFLLMNVSGSRCTSKKTSSILLYYSAILKVYEYSFCF